MSYLPVQSSRAFPSRLDRHVSRALERIDAETSVAMQADRARIERITQTTGYAMGAVAHLAAVEASLAEAAPQAREMLHAVASAGCAGLVGVVYQASLGR
jgi:hypothetical protein